MAVLLVDRLRAGARAAATTRGALTLLGVALLAGWAGLWAWGLAANRLPGGGRYWFEPFEHVGLDFEANYLAPRLWLAGGDPYCGLHLGPHADPYAYPPLLLWLFAWAAPLGPRASWFVWLAASALIAAAGAWAAGRTRERLGLWRVPWPLLLAAVLCSTPVLFALERGNCDLLVVAFILAAVWALRRRTWWGDVLAGVLVALAAWSKLYPGLLLVAFVAYRNWRGLLAAAAAGLLIFLLDVPGVFAFKDNMIAVVHKHAPGEHGWYHVSVHSLTGWWDVTWAGRRWRVPGVWVAAAALGTMVGWVGWRMHRCGRPAELLLPFLLWLAAAATFVPAIANDYNLVFLPLAALAVWDKRDPVWVHVLMGLLLLWWQPLLLPIDARFLFVCKLLGLAAVGVSLTRRALELRTAAAPPRPAALPALAA
jgi:hypothetical protein